MSDFTTTPPNADYQLTVAVRPEYLPDQSEPAAEHYVFAYHVTITNTGRVAAQVCRATGSSPTGMAARNR